MTREEKLRLMEKLIKRYDDELAALPRDQIPIGDITGAALQAIKEDYEGGDGARGDAAGHREAQAEVGARTAGSS